MRPALSGILAIESLQGIAFRSYANASGEYFMIRNNGDLTGMSQTVNAAYDITVYTASFPVSTLSATSHKIQVMPGTTVSDRVPILSTTKNDFTSRLFDGNASVSGDRSVTITELNL